MIIKNSLTFLDNDYLNINSLIKKVFLSSQSISNKLYSLAQYFQSLEYLRLTIASPMQIKKWTVRYLTNGIKTGEVIVPFDLKNKDLRKKMVNNSLFSQQIFGPIKDWRCSCNKYKGLKIGLLCPLCNVEITSSRMRRYNMGYVELIYPIAHRWYCCGSMKYISHFFHLACQMASEDRINKKNQNLTKDKKLMPSYSEESTTNCQIIDNSLFYTILSVNYRPYTDEINIDLFEKLFSQYSNFYLSTGIGLIREILSHIDLVSLLTMLRKKLITFLQTTEKNFKNLPFLVRIVENFLSTKTRPEWMILTRIPILPPSIRPFFKLADNTLQASTLNTFYDNILYNNTMAIVGSIKKSGSDSYINESEFSRICYELQNSVDQLFDNSRLQKENQLIVNDRPLTSLTEGLEGKFGRFRYTLLGKRVNFSARSVIIAGPTLGLNQCGLPYDIALKLFEPYIIDILSSKCLKLFKSPFELYKYSNFFNKPQLSLWILLKNLLPNYTIMLNRAPTLHKFGIQGFKPLLIFGDAIALPALVCTGFNADFDGDQMAVHLPLYSASQIEGSVIMSPINNILTPANGDVIVKPSQDIVIGSCYLTLMVEKERNIYLKYFLEKKDVLFSYFRKEIDLHTPILVYDNLALFKIIKTKSKIKIIDFILKKRNNEKEIKIKKCIVNFNFLYLLTNIGLIVAKRTKKKHFKFLNFFFKTTPGNLIFYENLKLNIL